MFTEGIYPIGDGLLDVDENRLKGLLVPHDINEIYDVEQTPFARGKFAAVRRAVHKISGVHFAAKFLKRRRRAQSSDKEIKHEIAVLMLCEGAENIVRLNAVHESRSDTALLLDLATGGELQTFLDNEECLSEAQARICMREVLKALQFLHKRSIVHLDLKPQNILLTGERIEDGLKLCDFGISRVVAEGTNVREIVGTPDYVAPEVLQYEPLSLLTDIWSVGVLAYVLLSGFSPFGGETKQETFLNISQCALTFPDKLFGCVSAEAIDFIRRALRIKPSDRMTAAGCLDHIWLKDECPIDRNIFNISENATSNANEHDDDDNIPKTDLKSDEEKGIASSIEHNDFRRNSSQMDSSDVEQEIHRQFASSGTAPTISSSTAVLHEVDPIKENDTKSVAKMTTTATTTQITSHFSVPATRATTIPLCSMQRQHQHLNIVGRRHSSDSNKENNFLVTKHVMPTAASALANGVGTKSSAAKTSTTIIIAPPTEMVQSATATVIATIKLPSGNNSCTDEASAEIAHCLFPDAPTTPKVIRKAPTVDTSLTSVKALVKKFQLDGSNAEKRLKEAQVSQQQQESHPTDACNRKSLSSSSSSRTNTHTKFIIKVPNRSSAGEYNKKYNHSISANNNNNDHRNTHMNSMRRCSEPITTVHKKCMVSSPTPSSASAPPNVASYKSTFFGLTCGGNSAGKSPTGCRHSGMANTRKSTTFSSRSSNGSSTATAILFNSHHQLQQHHHHHHHHHVAKSAANSLSLDQGIIC